MLLQNISGGMLTFYVSYFNVIFLGGDAGDSLELLELLSTHVNKFSVLQYPEFCNLDSSLDCSPR